MQATEDLRVRCTSALRMGLRMTKPLSQNTGMDTIQPMMIMAASGCFFPTILTTQSAILSAAPVFSSRMPTSAPRMMTMPMEVNVPLKPAPITSAICVRSIPATMARIRETPMMERKGWIFHLEIATIMRMIAMTNAITSGIPVMRGHLLKDMESLPVRRAFLFSQT